VKFFLDNCIAPVFAKVLNILAERQGHPIVHLRDKFPPDTKDPEWIRALAEEGEWIIVSGDPRISREKAERQAWQESRLTAFFFGDGWTS
jgi:predicted nuclease of predicted toxin-antitoxin system